MSDREELMQEARAGREQARALLAALNEAIDASGCAKASNHKDLFRQVTGCSSLEQALQSTRRLIETYDRVLAEAAGEPEAEAPMLKVVCTGRGPIGPWTVAAMHAGRTA